MEKKEKSIASKEAHKEKKRACLIIFLSFTCICLTLLLYTLINKKAEMENEEKVKELYGIWIEKEVVGYAADSFELLQDGVYFNQKKIATKFQVKGLNDKKIYFNITYDKKIVCTFFDDYLKCKNPLRHYEQVYEKSKTGYFIKLRK